MKVLTTDWDSSHAQLSFVRKQVFILEQRIDERDEWDELDQDAIHFVAFGTTAVPTGVCRLLENGQIGRLAVLPAYRHQGYATLLLRKAIQVAREMSLIKVFLHAQTENQVFYEKYGFSTDGKIFIKAGLPHILMEREI